MNVLLIVAGCASAAVVAIAVSFIVGFRHGQRVERRRQELERVAARLRKQGFDAALHSLARAMGTAFSAERSARIDQLP